MRDLQSNLVVPENSKFGTGVTFTLQGVKDRFRELVIVMDPQLLKGMKRWYSYPRWIPVPHFNPCCIPMSCRRHLPSLRPEGPLFSSLLIALGAMVKPNPYQVF